MSEKKTYIKENYEIVPHKSWILETDGVNLLNIFNSEYVDPGRYLLQHHLRRDDHVLLLFLHCGDVQNS